ncbi:MAG TPA: hypothetical protein VFL47_07845, partial [Flavisolibacter sp.]|nr:hypothetical protein [Flavisolibacter sp.]
MDGAFNDWMAVKSKVKTNCKERCTKNLRLVFRKDELNGAGKGDDHNVNNYFTVKNTVWAIKIVKNGKEIYFYETNPKF